MNSVEHQVLDVLRRYASDPTARGMLRRALVEVEVPGKELGVDALPRVRRALAAGIRLFVDERNRERVTSDLLRLEGERDLPPPMTIPIHDERDARRARILARSMCLDAGSAPLTALKAATALSELTRNILAYAGEGSVYIAIEPGPPRYVRVEAIDAGPGIPHLDEVLGGRYRSKTGLGKGIVGTRKIADRFDISTGTAGTRIEFEVNL